MKNGPFKRLLVVTVGAGMLLGAPNDLRSQEPIPEDVVERLDRASKARVEAAAARIRAVEKEIANRHRHADKSECELADAASYAVVINGVVRTHHESLESVRRAVRDSLRRRPYASGKIRAYYRQDAGCKPRPPVAAERRSYPTAYSGRKQAKSVSTAAQKSSYAPAYGGGASAQECCPISDALSKPLPLLAPRVTYPMPYQFNVTTYPLEQFRQIGLPYPIVYRGQSYEFTGLVVGGQPIYRRTP